MNCLLTIIVPIYMTKEDDLRFCIDSLLKQKSNEYKIILIDDGSPDNCGKICDEYKKISNKIEVIHQNNRGVSEARNSGIKNAKSDWIFFVDPDDWIEENAIDEIVDFLNKKSDNIDILMFNYFNEYSNRTTEQKINVKEGLMSDTMLQELRKSPFFKFYVDGKESPYSSVAVWNKIYNRTFLNNHNIRFLSRAKKGEDRLFNANTFNLSEKIYYLNKFFYHYRCYSYSTTNKYNKDIVKMTEIEVNELKKTIEKYKIQQYNELLNARICTRLYSCLRLLYYNKANTMKKKEIKQEIQILLKSEPFFSALNSINYELLNMQEKTFVFCIKYKLLFGLKVLIYIKEKGIQKKIRV